MRTERISLRADEGREDVTLTSYLLDSIAGVADGPRPSVLVCPGGGNLKCSDREGEPVALFFNSLGYHAFVLRYSVYFKESANGDAAFAEMSEGGVASVSSLSPRAQVVYPAPIVDVEKAMLMIGENAERWQIDVDRVALCGFSSGGHTAALYAAEWGQPVVSEVTRGSRRIRPAALVLGYPVVDRMGPLSGATLVSRHPELKTLNALSDLALFGTTEPSEDLRRKASVTCQITKEMPPTFIWATSEDESVSVEQSLSLATALSTRGVPFALHVFEHGSHGLSLASWVTARQKDQVRPDVAQWTKLVQGWLDERFLAEREEK
jgi:acetyl esterase/lipase